MILVSYAVNIFHQPRIPTRARRSSHGRRAADLTPGPAMPEPTVTVLHARGVLDVDSGEVTDFGYVRVERNRITAVTADENAAADADERIELPDLVLIPGLMDMEVDLVLGGPGAGLNDPVRLDPVKMTLRGAANARRTLLAGFTTVRNLGLFVKTERVPARRRARGSHRRRWIDGPASCPRATRSCPTGGHLDPSAQIQPRAAHHAALGRGGDRRRHRSGPSRGPLPDQARREGHQVLRVGGVISPTGRRRPAVLHRGDGRDRRGGSPARAQGGAHCHGDDAGVRASSRHRLHRARVS
jgi:hypothetical protein